MKIPIDAEIAKEKITEYLLKKLDENDKSHYLISGGYTLEQYENLIVDLRNQILPLDALQIDTTEYGEKYEIEGLLKGPSGRELFVKTIWMREHVTDKWKFITLFPDKRKVE